MNASQLIRFDKKVEKNYRSGCWLWTGAIDQYGYGKLLDRGAHRVAYEHFVGDVPDGLHLDHLCRVRACVNPGHLEPVTVGENIRRGHEARGTAGGRSNPERRREARRRYDAKKRAEAGPPAPPHNTLKTHCPQGHAYDEENTYVIPSRPTARYCRACKRARRGK